MKVSKNVFKLILVLCLVVIGFVTYLSFMGHLSVLWVFFSYAGAYFLIKAVGGDVFK